MIMELETKIMLGYWLCLFVGAIIGWYVTAQHYWQKEKERREFQEGEASAFLKEHTTLPPPPTYLQKVWKVINDLNRVPVDEYHIVAGGMIYEGRPIEEQEDIKKEEL